MKERDFDALLDEVLREDAGAEPRDGFEARMLVPVRAEAGSGSLSWWRQWRGWMVVPAAACAGLMMMVWYGSARRAALPVSSSVPSGLSVMKHETVENQQSLAEVDGGLRLGKGGRASREAHLSDDKAVAKMGHPVVVTEDRPLPKLDVFPSPAPVDVFPSPIHTGRRQAVPAELSVQAGAALVSLREEQSKPLRVEAIEVAPIEVTSLNQVR